MATVRQPSPGLFAAALHALSSTAPRSRSLATTMNDLVEGLTVAHAESLPRAIGEVMPLLRADTERLRFAAEIAVRLDLFEVAPFVTELATSTNDPDLLLAAATLCGNPAVHQSLRNRIASMVGSERTGLIPVDPATIPETAEEKYLYWQSWPGACSDDIPFPLSPVVVLDQGFNALRSLRLAISLDQAGAVVRRLVPESDIPMWFGSQTVVLCSPRTRTRVLSAYPKFPEARIIPDPLPEDDRKLGLLMRRINAVLPGPQKLRFNEFPVEISENLWDPEVFMAGVYNTKDVAFLSGSQRSPLDRLRLLDLLTPLTYDPIRWAFRDLVAFRTWSYLKSVSPRRVSTSVVPALAGFAGDSKAVKLGVTSEGAVLVDRGDGWANVETGQRPLGLEITDVDDAFRPFSYGDGKAPALPIVGPNTPLHPSVLHGTPHLKGHRISAKSLAALDRRNGRKAILSAYPELENVTFDDTVGVGYQLLSAS
ncbi:MAG: hypothetical protein OXF41_19680 [bacterium]|nr:hypothetical protein [bacterium]